MAPTRRSPLHAVQADAGARFAPWQGALWATDFGDPLAEHHAVREAVGVWDVSALHVWEVRGPDARGAVGRSFTNDLAELDPGAIRYGVLCAEDGAIVNDATAFTFGPRRIWVTTSMASDGEHLQAHVHGTGISVRAAEQRAVLQVQGPAAGALLASLGAPVGGLRFFRFRPAPVLVAGIRCLLARLGFSGELGYELFCAADDGVTLWQALTAAGARPYGFAAVETLRIEAALPLLGAEFVSRCTRPHDVSLDRFVALTKPFVGRDAIASLAANPSRRLVTLIADGDRLPAAGAHVWAGEGLTGRVTSACRSPTYGTVVALACVTTSVATEGRRLLVDGEPVTVRRDALHDPGGHRRRADPVLGATPRRRASPGTTRNPARQRAAPDR